MALRHDAGYAAMAIAASVRDLVLELGGAQVGTVGAVTLHPNLVNVVAGRAVMTVDLRNTDDAILRESERRFAELVAGSRRPKASRSRAAPSPVSRR